MTLLRDYCQHETAGWAIGWVVPVRLLGSREGSPRSPVSPLLRAAVAGPESELPRVLLASLLAGCGSAAQSSSGSDQAVLIQKLMDRIDQLEKRVSELEGEKRANTGAPASPASDLQLFRGPDSEKLTIQQKVVNNLQRPSDKERNAYERRLGKQDAHKQRSQGGPGCPSNTRYAGGGRSFLRANDGHCV